MYLAAPDCGRRRRALIRDKVSRGVHQSRSGFQKNLARLPRFMTHLRQVRDLGNGRSH